MTSTASPAGKSFPHWMAFLGVFAAGLAADLWSKSAVFAWLSRTEPTSASRAVIPGAMRFTLSTNPGIVFGFDKMPPTVVMLASVLAVVVVVYFFATSPRKAHCTHTALAMILAGALGNLYDRLFSRVQLPGRPPSVREVRDFIDLGQLHYPWVFNVADVLLVVGVVILILAALIPQLRKGAVTPAGGDSGTKGRPRE